MTDIIISIIGSLATISVALIGLRKANKEGWANTANALTTSLAVFEEKVEELTREVRLHNNFASKIPILESDLSRQEKEISELKKELKELEKIITKMGGV